ncbi:hypothetical protein LCGC14_2593590 [marine sediment metagenome]|uniref:Uncharacterized protein n=1 Tax=marine sediment metagenome TaxID=412755 RepID=A0A0F9AB45_9ZZZZ
MEWLWLTLALALAFLLGFVVASHKSQGVLAKASVFWEEAVKLKDAADKVHNATQATLAQAEELLRKAQELDNQTRERL